MGRASSQNPLTKFETG
jgi:hypothetical protein